ncbi:MAG: DUF262 domain-containing protein [Nostoc sp.]
MQASEIKLQQIIEGTKQYVVPLFQRAYSWKKSEWQALWNDLVELCATDNPRPHFMGSIVTMPTTSVPEGVRMKKTFVTPENFTMELSLRSTYQQKILMHSVERQ